MLFEGEPGLMGGGGGGNDDPPKDDPPKDDPPKDDPPGVQFQWPEGLDDHYRDHVGLQSFANDKGEFDLGKLMKSWVHTKSAVGTDKIPVPTKHFTDEQWRETYERLGLPKELTDYGIENTVPEGLQADEEFFEGFKKTAHEVGVLPKQAQKLVDYYNETLAKSIKADIDQKQSDLTAAQNDLKNEWGDAYNRKLGEAEQAVMHFASKEEVDALRGTGIFNNPTFSRVFAKIAEAMNAEDTFDTKTTGKLSMTVEEITKEIDDLRNSEQYRDPMHPRNKRTRDQMQSLYEKRRKAKANMS